MRLSNTLTRIGAILVFLLLALYMSSPSRSIADPESAADYRLHPPDQGWVRKTLRKMSLRDKVGQLVHIRVPGRFLNRAGDEFTAIRDEIVRNRVGGVILFAGNIYESAVLLNELQELSDVPLIVAADFERGASFRITDTTSFPWTMAIGATGNEQLAYQEGAVTGQEARALGVHWIYAPVMDVNNNPANPVINIRSFGEDPQLVARLGTAFIRGARDHGVLTTAKHFPGHGDTAADSHIGLAVVGSDQARLESVELVPFRGAIAAGVDSIMTAHVAVPKVTADPEIPATLSSKILTDLLRGTLGFQGMIITDALEMGGITNRYWTGLSAVRAIQAGADLLLLPPDSEVAINEVVRAVERGDLAEERINTSVERLLTAKTQLQLHKKRTVPIEQIAEAVSTPESRRLGQEIADAAVTLVKDRQNILPINPVKPPSILGLVLSSELDTSPGAPFLAALRERFPAARTIGADPRISEDLVSSIMAAAAKADVIVCASMVRVVSGKGTVALPENHRAIIHKLFAMGKPVVWIAFGNPYILQLHTQALSYMCTFSYSDVSQIAAAKALSGEIALSGRMPVSIPDGAKVGEGLQVPRLDMTLRPMQQEGSGQQPDAFDATRKLLENYVAEQAFPGAVLMVGHRGTLVVEAAVGKLDYSPDATPVSPDTIYDLASLSKAIATTSAAMMLVDSGRLLLDAAVQDYLPEFKGPNKEKVRVSNLLTHSAGLPAFLPLYKEVAGYRQFLTKVYDAPLEYEPGSRMVYSDLGMVLLGEIISRASARPLDRLLAERLFGPLGMQDTMYVPPKSLAARIAPTEDDPWRKRVVRGEVHDENAFAMGGVAGHAGLFSTGRDLAVFAQMMLNQGLYDHRRYLKPETAARFTSQRGPEGSAQGFGWRKPSPANWTGQVFSPAAYGHTGFTGTSIWIEPAHEAFIILLTNRVHPTRKNQKIDEARRTISESVMSVLKGAAGLSGAGCNRFAPPGIKAGGRQRRRFRLRPPGGSNRPEGQSGTGPSS